MTSIHVIRRRSGEGEKIVKNEERNINIVSGDERVCYALQDARACVLIAFPLVSSLLAFLNFSYTREYTWPYIHIAWWIHGVSYANSTTLLFSSFPQFLWINSNFLSFQRVFWKLYPKCLFSIINIYQNYNLCRKYIKNIFSWINSTQRIWSHYQILVCKCSLY